MPRQAEELLPVPPDALCGDCGHPASAHRPRLPSPCLHGHLGPLERLEAFKKLYAEGVCWIEAVNQILQHPGACQCVGFTRPLHP